MTKALRILDTTIDKVTGQEIILEPQALLFLMNEYLVIAVNSQSKNTIDAYTLELERLANFTNGNLSDTGLLAFKTKVIDKMSPRSANRCVSVVKGFLKFLVYNKGIMARNYFEGIKNKKIDKNDSPYVALTPSQVRKMIDYPDRNSLLGASQRIVLVLGFYLGLRESEICSLTYGSFSDDFITILGKGKKTRRIPMTKELKEELIIYVSTVSTKIGTPDKDRCFIETRESNGKVPGRMTIYRWFNSIAKACGIDDFSPHSARATAITNALDNGVSIRDVQVLAGHSSVDTTSIYDKRRGEASLKAVKGIKY